jgi:hypothetical protein
MTEFYLGRRTQFSYAIEVGAYGTANPASTWAWLGQVQKVSPTDKFDIKELDAMDDVDTRNPTAHDVLVKRYGGTVSFLPQHMRHLVLPFGDNSDSKTGTTPTTHTITATNTLPHFGMQVGYQHTSPFGIRYDGAVANTYEIGSTKGDWVRSTIGFVAKTATKITSFKSYQASATPLKKYTSAQVRPFRHSDVTATINNIDYSVALNQWRLTMDNQVVAEPHDEDTISEPVPTLRKWTGSFDVNMSSSALWDLKELATKIANTTKIVIARSSGSDEVAFTFNDPTIEVLNPPFDVTQGLVNASLSVVATSISPIVKDSLDVDFDTVR